MSETLPSLPFYRLIYTSRVTPSIDIGALLRQAQKNNPPLEITGGLAVLEGVCLQYLEGSEDAVESLFARILPDARHADVKVLERRAVPRRMFNDWSMAMLNWTEDAKQIFRSFSPGIHLNLYDTDPTTAAPLFRAWAATADWHRMR
ncbi:BLUF domain-containing protein [Variovorax sp. LT1R16]|uniref:BLUF domain-containing protein n=1 Tax=Variovorax sp. LT1R16 TaxID=3443728 RepID=UPI003F48C935